MIRIKQYACILASILLFAPMAMAASAGVINPGWKLVFADDFNGSSLDTRKWSRIDYQPHPVADWRRYQSQDKSLVKFGKKNGVSAMTLWGKYGYYKTQSNQQVAKQTYACGGVYTLNTFSFQYGYVEVRARFDCVQGTWPAIWMLPKGAKPWPNGGEIDILEHLNHDASVYQTIHYSKANDGKNTGTKGVHPAFTKGKPNGWHTYGMKWTPDAITFYLDGKQTGIIKKPADPAVAWPFDDADSEFYLLIDQQIGGKWVEGEGKKGIDQATLKKTGAAFAIDYVKVYSTPEYKHPKP